jgi:RNA polymerase sigma-70 factor, ECF subfamily
MTTDVRFGPAPETTLRWRLPSRSVTPNPGRSPGRPDNAQLDSVLKAVAGGDRESFGHLYDLVIAAVFGLIRRLVRDPSQSEEVTQEVMLEVWRTAPRYDPAQGSAIGWILTIARRRAIDRVRSEQAARDRVERVAPGQIEREHDHVAEEAVRSSDRTAVSHALANLGTLQREAIELAFYGGLTQSEIAGRLGVPLGTIKTRIRDGMLRLQETLSTSR